MNTTATSDVAAEQSRESGVTAYVVTGPFGAGKTTIINHLLRQLPNGQRPKVIVNDFGAVNPDKKRIEEQSGVPVETITSGCIACSSLDQLIAIAEIAQKSGTTALVIEPSGGIDGDELPVALSIAGVRYCIIAMVNARDFELDICDGLLPSQLRHAQMAVVTRGDSIAGIKEAFMERITNLTNNDTPVLFFDHNNPNNVDEIIRMAREKITQPVFVRSPAPFVSLGRKKKNDERGAMLGQATVDHNRIHTSYTETLLFPEGITSEQILKALNSTEFPIRRAKGVCIDQLGKRRDFDWVWGSFSLGLETVTDCHVLLIHTDDPNQVEEGKRYLLKANTDPARTTASIERWSAILKSTPPIKADGKPQLRCDAFILLTLALRKNVPENVRIEAVSIYTQWLLESIKAVRGFMNPNNDSSYKNEEIGSWLFILGKHASRILVEERKNLDEKTDIALLKTDVLGCVLEGINMMYTGFMACAQKELQIDPSIMIDLEQWPLPGKNAGSLLRGCLATEKNSLDRHSAVVDSIRMATQMIHHASRNNSYKEAWQKLLQEFENNETKNL